jgi:hypothetical protein
VRRGAWPVGPGVGPPFGLSGHGAQGENGADLHGEAHRAPKAPTLREGRCPLAKVFLIHWNEDECRALAESLRHAGHDVAPHWNTETGAPLKDALPDVAVISLERLPSHGRAVAEWLWEARKRQHIPIIFTGGEPAKVQATRERFPKARFCPTRSLLATIEKVTGP